jgi:superfamily II DNA/RNA helicase
MMQQGTAFSTYAFSGKLTDCRDDGTGKVRLDTKPVTTFRVHISCHGGKVLRSLENHEGQPILFACGGRPSKYAKGGADWKQWVVKWVLLDQVEGNLSLANVDERQEDYLNNLVEDDFYAFLSAKWYVELWKKDARSPPLTPLVRTEVLNDVFIKRLKSSKNLTELIRLLHAMEQSPWFDVPSSKNASSASSAYIQVLLKDINSWPPAPFHIPPDRQISKNLNNTYLRWEKLLMPRIRKANAVAIDLETNGDAIFQIGWFPFVKTGLAQRAKGLSQKQIQEAISTCLPPGSTPCIVGQNLLAWDLPILLSKGVELPANTPTWDTLIASWLLAPWEPSHALVVQENAHRADADAKETYKRYVEQVEKLTPCLHTPIANIYALIDNLFEHPELLRDVRSLANPHALNASGPKPVLIPTSRKREATWSPRLKLTYLTVERDLEDPVLKPECCFDIGRSSNDILARTIAVVVADAHRQGVFIRLSMLPKWLVDDALRDRLRTAHHDFRPEANDAVYTPVYLASDLHNHDAAWIERLAGDTGFEIPYPEETALEWLSVHAKPLTYHQIQARFPPAVLENRSRRELLLVHDANGAQMLLFEPPGLGDEAPCWWGFESPPDWLAGSESSATRPDNHEKWFRLPCWKEGEIDDLDLSRIFATPDTLNRRLHISEILLQLLNLLRAKENSDQILLCGMRWPGEAQKAQQILAALSKTVIHAESPLRQLQHLCKLNRDILICAQRDLPQYLDAAEKLDLSLRVVLDEAPLHQWLAITELRNKAPAREASTPALQTVSLTNHAIKTGLYTMLVPWLKGLLKREDPMPTPVLVLDARLFDLPGGKDIQFPWENIPFYQNEELLPNPEDLKAFQALTVRPPEEINTTCSYEDMERLFQNHWGHDKFNPLQAPAVRALAETEEDLLLRLPTGAGKSAVFQVPALLVGSKSKRLSIVISPLRALMTDQVTGLHAKHFSETVDYLSGGREPWVNHDVYRGIVDGRLQLVYVAPERFRVPRFVEALERRRANDGGLEFIVFDEAHCVSEWGFDFRPDYLYAAGYVANWRRGMTLPGKGHRLLLTSATVTERNREDLESKLLGTDSGYANLPSPEDMPHPIQDFIQLESMVADDADDAAASGKYRKVVDILEKLDLKKSAAIIFVRRRVDCHALAEALNAEAGRPESVIPHAKALPFHAGLSESIKNEAIELLNKERSVNVLVCTKAFGMGMDISHLHACIHYSPTNFIEDYLQEVGRIGRGKEERLASGHAQVKATLLFNQQDFDDNLKRLEESAIKPPDLEDFFNYCRSIPSGISHNDQWVCLVPTSINTPGHKVFNENQVSACLFWLEQAKVLRVEAGILPT